MTIVANVRANIAAPFPSLAKGSGLIAVSKANGIWTVQLQPFSILGLMPPATPLAQVEILVWNTINSTFQQTNLQALLATEPPSTKITSANSPYTPLPTDTFLLVDTTAGAVEIDLDVSANRNGVPLSIKDWKGTAVTHAITIKPKNAETVDGYTNGNPLVINSNYDAVRLKPDVASYVIAP